MQKLCFILIICFVLGSFVSRSAEPKNHICTLNIPHTHEKNWIKIQSPDKSYSILFREQTSSFANFSNLVINIFDWLKKDRKLVLNYEKLEKILICFTCQKNDIESQATNSEKISQAIQIIQKNYPNVRFIDFGLFDPKNKNNFVKIFELEDSNEIKKLINKFKKIPIVINQNTYYGACLDVPHNEAEFIKQNKKLMCKQEEKTYFKYWQQKLNCALVSIPVGIGLGAITWVTLATKDAYCGVVLEGGHEFNAYSIDGLSAPIVASIIAVGAVSASLDINLYDYLPGFICENSN